FYNYDAHGNVITLTDTNYSVVKSYTYDAFGNEINPDPNDQNPFRYCGEYFDKETGDYYLRARYYDTSTGRFLTEAPAISGSNWYIYAENNPIMFTDPSGLVINLPGVNSNNYNDDARFQNIQKLTGDQLYVDDNGNVQFAIGVNDGSKASGSALVSALIDSHKTCTIVYTDQGSGTAPRSLKKATNGKGTDATIYFNASDPVKVLTMDADGNTSYTVEPKDIELGHEMIHALHDVQGTNARKKQGKQAYTDTDGTVEFESWNQEELNTTGVDYINENGKINWASGYDITENSLRKEQGLDRRDRYLVSAGVN
ncbi:MAG: RHS repeat-associated core domain-containing protein, partial [Bacillota bacterium]|nr:RHS repeat-associated core domain-containing protein [Bacillota bacterium]